MAAPGEKGSQKAGAEWGNVSIIFHKKAVLAFRKYFAIKHRNAKDEMEKYDDFYRSCFKYTTPTGTVMVP